MHEPESPNSVPYQAYKASWLRSKRQPRNVSRPTSFISEKQQAPVLNLQPTPPSTPPPHSSPTRTEYSKLEEPNGSATSTPPTEPEPDPEPEPESRPVSPPVASTSTASPSPVATTSTTAAMEEARPSPRKTTTFRRVAPRKSAPQTHSRTTSLSSLRHSVIASPGPSPLSQSSSPVVRDERPLPPAPDTVALVAPQPQHLAPSPRSSSLQATPIVNGISSLPSTTIPSPLSRPPPQEHPVSSPPPSAVSQPSSPAPAAPTPVPSAKSPTPRTSARSPQSKNHVQTPYRPGFQPKPSYRHRTDEFIAARHATRDGKTEGGTGMGEKRIERTKLERRLEKLIALHFPDENGRRARPAIVPVQKQERRASSIFDMSLSDLRASMSFDSSSGGSGLWKGVVGGGAKNDMRAAEQRITPWQEDSEVSKCPHCSTSFHPLSNRKHHCRLCGKIICNLPVKHPVRPVPCSLLFVVDPKTRKIEEVGEGVDYGVRKRTGPGDQKRSGKGGEEDEEKFLKGVRICRECRPVLVREQYERENAVVPPFVRLYDSFVALEKEIEDSLPQFQEMILSLNQDPSHQQSITKEAAAVRKRLLEAFAQYDAFAKRIRKLPGSDGKPLKPGSSQDRVQAAVMTRANFFLQKNMFPLQSLPKPSSRANSTSGSPSPEPSVLPIDLDSQVAHALQPLLEQEALLETFVEEATAQRKFEDAKTLRANLKEIRQEIDRILSSIERSGNVRRVGS
uniref:FYVE-type domain-containing protein n=1 Tax=Moniliophthora roreri TaxID=221103 RepID=A0A0W0F3S0_MONRR